MIRAVLCLLMLAGPLHAQSAGETNAASLRLLDRMTGDRFDVVISDGQVYEKGTLKVRVSACRFPASNPASDAFAYVTVEDTNLEEQVFQGWMVASSPALNALDHPRYDVWVLRCRSS